jgi:CDP-glycerol glycerophosphotransferase (TagB/SpsB family)
LYVSRRVHASLPQSLKDKQVFSNLAEARAYNPEFVLVPRNFVDHRIPGIKVQIFHGLGVEKAAHFKNRGFFDVYLTSGPYVTQRFIQMRARNPYFEVIETGWLKIDAILNFDITNLRERLNVPASKRVILYAPTFSRKMESAAELASVIPNIIRDDEYWLFKFHELMPKELIAPYKAIAPTRGKIYEGNDINPCLHLADVMISDTSSVVYEFYALDKPVITFKALERPQKALDIRDPALLREAIYRCLDDADDLKSIRAKAIAEVNPYLDASIAKRTLRALEGLDRKIFPEPGKPANLFRKAQIIWHGLVKKGYLR